MRRDGREGGQCRGGAGRIRRRAQRPRAGARAARRVLAREVWAGGRRYSSPDILEHKAAHDAALTALLVAERAAARREALESAALVAEPDTDGISDGERLFADGRRAAARDIRALASQVKPSDKGGV